MKKLLVLALIMLTAKGSSTKVVNIKNELSLVNDYWNLKTIGLLGDRKIKVGKLKGPFKWHHHEKEDEMFYVLKGHLIIHLRDAADVHIHEGELAIVPHLTEHNPEAPEEAELLLIR